MFMDVTSSNHHLIFHLSKLLFKGGSSSEEKSGISPLLVLVTFLAPIDEPCEPPVEKLRVYSRCQKNKTTLVVCPLPSINA